MRRQGLRSTGFYLVSKFLSNLCNKILPSGVSVESWDLLPTLWSLRRPRKRYSGTLTEREISKNGEWGLNGKINNHFIDRYLTLVTCMNESIVRIAQEHGKTPQVHCPIQNKFIYWKCPIKGCGEDGKLPPPSCYFITVEDSCVGLNKVGSSLTSDMHCQLFELCICNFNTSCKYFLTLFHHFSNTCLRRDTKQKYNDALHSYVTQYFGRPLEKVSQKNSMCFQKKNPAILKSVEKQIVYHF